ncbi:MAG: hypothetical protein WA366_12830, partial [Pseudolabrys sp.]
AAPEHARLARRGSLRSQEMFYWIYDLPALWVIVLFEVVFVGACWLGTLFLRPLVRSRLHEEPRLNDMLAAFLQYFGIIYGLLLGLLAIATYQDRLDVEKSNANEASSLSALYRNVSAYPEPSRSELQNLLREHTHYLIEDAWPQQRKGVVPVDESHRITTLQTRLALFEPQTKAQELLHENTLRQFNTFYQDRRARIYSLTAGIPAILWYTVAVGALINMILLWMFDLRPHAQWILGGLISFYLGTVIAVIALMDHPYRGELGLSPDAFQMIYHGVMHQE